MVEHKLDVGHEGDRKLLPKINIQCYDISHAGANNFLEMLQPDPHAFLSKCLDAVVKALYISPGHAKFHLPDVSSITIVVRPMSGVAHTKGNILDNKHKEIHISADYVLQLFGRTISADQADSQSVPSPTPTIAPPPRNHPHNVLPSKGHEDRVHRAAKREIEGVIVHEMVHAMQYTGNETCPGGLIEGIADWVRLQADLAPPHWKEKPDNKNWNSGYETTAYFLRWTSQKLSEPLLVSKLNEAFRLKPWNDGQLFKSLCGKTVEEAWSEYQKALES